MDPLLTRRTLLLRIRTPDDGGAWTEFVGLYEPLLRKYVLLRGVPLQDVEDVVQEVLKTVTQAIRKFEYDPERGTFRDWLFIVCRSHVTKYRRQNRTESFANEKVLEELAAEEKQADWDVEYRRRMFEWATERVRPLVQEKTWNAFWLTAVDDKSGPEVAATLGMSVGAVHVARSRIIARMREAIASATGEAYEQP
ncbi:MAG: sigma-70 family RNA polymerase sigma factor [Verrucomicrobiaceae bacterium]|nr:sigma-70 family RNA polymerase sigma factor [Verrucomicrobiaceae bacterium]